MRFSSSARNLSLLSCAFLLGSCAYATKASFQDITFISPDAQDAKCLVYASGVKYQVWPPQTVNIKKSAKPMTVVCHAPGNRTVEVEVSPRVETTAMWGTPVGVAWDYASQSLYSYPEVIAIDFSQESLKAFSLPKHNNEDIRQPESYDLEEFLPGDPRLNSDKYKTKNKLLRRGESKVEWEDAEESNLESDNPAGMDNEVEAVQGEAVQGNVGAQAEGASEEVVGEVVGESVQGQEFTAISEILTPISESTEVSADTGLAEATAQDVTADSAPVPLVPGE